jgi:hypothetical protein
MKLHNIRLGFACNSSSSHSMVIIGDKKVKDNYNYDYGDFGWDNFTLASKQAKLTYLSVLFQELFDPSEGRVTVQDHNIDHQSMWNLFPEYLELYKKIAKRVLKPDVAILGGNDNDESPHPLAKHPRLSFQGLERYSNLKFREDGEFYTVFNPNTGLKFRVSENADTDYVKSAYPELVDVKITDYCEYGCPYCYQNSSVNGKHASLESITQVAAALKDLEVFEVALGGGEPTAHPHFMEIVGIFNKNDIVVNLSTKNFDYIKKQPKSFFEKFGAIAVSANSIQEAELIVDYNRKCYNDRNSEQEVYLQVVAGVLSVENIAHIIHYCNRGDTHYFTQHHLTILGYKDYGRGLGLQTYDYKGFLPDLIIKTLNVEHSTVAFGIDSVLVDEIGKDLVDNGVMENCMIKGEGNFSMYIDAVNKKMGPSSFTPTTCSFTNNCGQTIEDEYPKW